MGKMHLLICPLLRRRKIPLMSFPTAQNSTWRSGRDFIPIMMRMIQSNGFGNTLILKIILFGGQTISTMMNLQWSSCPVISLEVCSRLEKFKKNAFASAALFGEDNNSSISGIWVWKGQKLAFDLCEDWQIDYSSYDWVKLDPAADETKALVTQYWKWEGEDKQGRKFNQGKILK